MCGTVSVSSSALRLCRHQRPIVQMGTPRLREAEGLAQGHTAGLKPRPEEMGIAPARWQEGAGAKLQLHHRPTAASADPGDARPHESESAGFQFLRCWRPGSRAKCPPGLSLFPQGPHKAPPCLQADTQTPPWASETPWGRRTREDPGSPLGFTAAPTRTWMGARAGHLVCIGHLHLTGWKTDLREWAHTARGRGSGPCHQAQGCAVQLPGSQGVTRHQDQSEASCPVSRARCPIKSKVKRIRRNFLVNEIPCKHHRALARPAFCPEIPLSGIR